MKHCCFFCFCLLFSMFVFYFFLFSLFCWMCLWFCWLFCFDCFFRMCAHFLHNYKGNTLKWIDLLIKTIKLSKTCKKKSKPKKNILKQTKTKNMFQKVCPKILKTFETYIYIYIVVNCFSMFFLFILVLLVFFSIFFYLYIYIYFVDSICVFWMCDHLLYINIIIERNKWKWIDLLYN